MWSDRVRFLCSLHSQHPSSFYFSLSFHLFSLLLPRQFSSGWMQYRVPARGQQGEGKGGRKENDNDHDDDDQQKVTTYQTPPPSPHLLTVLVTGVVKTRQRVSKKHALHCYRPLSTAYSRLILGAFEKLRKDTIMLARLSVICPSVRMEQMDCHWTDCHGILYMYTYRKFVR